MSDFNSQLERMKSLMTYGKIEEEKTPSCHTLEFKAEAADGKIYGIIKEQSKYYIKYTDKGKETLAESYQYIGGVNNKKAHEYTSYANALKNFEMKLNSLNEAHDANVNISTLDPFRREEIIAEASDAMKDEIARCRQIMYNSSMLMNESTAIGATPITNQPEAEHENSGDKDEPFTDEVKPDMEFEGEKETKPEDAGDPFVEGEKGSKAEEPKDINVEDSVASEHPAGAEAVKMNEGIEEEDLAGFPEAASQEELDAVESDEAAKEAAFNDIREALKQAGKTDEEIEDMLELIAAKGDALMEELDLDDELVLDEPEDKETEVDVEEPELGVDEPEAEPEEGELEAEPEAEPEEELTDEPKEGDLESRIAELEAEIEELKAQIEGDDLSNETEEELTGEEEPEGEDVLDIEEPEAEDEIEGDVDECGFTALNEDTLNALTDKVIAHLLKEDVLHVFGDHPGYRKQPMTVKAEGPAEPFGQDKGDSQPFDEKKIDELTDVVFNKMVDNGLLKKK